jgi:hypothetical protein
MCHERVKNTEMHFFLIKTKGVLDYKNILKCKENRKFLQNRYHLLTRKYDGMILKGHK